MVIQSWTVDYRSSAVSTSAFISKAIRDDHLEELPGLILQATTIMNNDKTRKKQQHPLWQANSRGWTPMHVAAASSSQIPYSWWKWILQEQQQGHNPETTMSTTTPTKLLWTRKTDMGQTCIDLFFRTSLCPLPWQRHAFKEKAQKICQTIEERILCDTEVLQQLRDRINENCHCHYFSEEDEENDGNEAIPVVSSLDEGDDDEEDSSLELVVDFWKKMHRLLYTAYYDGNTHVFKKGQQLPQHNDRSSPLPVLHLLASLPWCPEIVARLALALYPWQCWGQSDDECFPYTRPTKIPLPLHRWSQTPTRCHFYQEQQYHQHDAHQQLSHRDEQNHSNTSSASTKKFALSPSSTASSIQSLLCQSFPAAARIPDPTNHGRLPIHSALALGKPWEEDIQVLFDTFPDALLEPDPLTKLPCFCLAAAIVGDAEDGCGNSIDNSNRKKEITEYTAKQLDQQRLSLCWSYLSKREKDRALQRAHNLLECQQLSTIYQVLRRSPSAVQVAVMASSTTLSTEAGKAR